MGKYKLISMFMIVFLFSAQAFAECKQDEASGGEILGTLAGAALGGLVGSQFGGGKGKAVMIGAGVVAGGFLGNKIGKELSCKDQEQHYETTQNALETGKTGQKSSWVNPDSGHSGEVTPTRTYTATDGTPCRDFSQTIYVDGKYENVEGTACRQPDGTWKPVEG